MDSQNGLRIIKTFILIFIWIVMGMDTSVVTSTLPDLRTRLNTTVAGISYAFTLGSVGAFISSFASGIFDRYYVYIELLVGALMILIGVMDVITPMVATLPAFATVRFVLGMSWSMVNSAGNAMIIALWGDAAGSSLQAMHLGFPLGAFLGGILSIPFVSVETSANNTDECEYENVDCSRIEIAFYIVAGSSIILGIICSLFYFKQFTDAKFIRDNSEWKDIINPSKWSNGDSKFAVTVITLMCLFYFFLVSAVLPLGLYISTYAVDSDLGFTAAEAAALNGISNGVGGIGRAVFIPIAKLLTVNQMLIVNGFGQFIGSILAMTIGTKYKLGLTLTVSFYSFFRDPFYPTGFAWAGYYIKLLVFSFGMTAIAYGISLFIFNPLIGYLYTNTVIESIFYLTAFWSGVMCILVVVMWVLSRKQPGLNTIKSVIVNEEYQITKL